MFEYCIENSEILVCILFPLPVSHVNIVQILFALLFLRGAFLLLRMIDCPNCYMMELAKICLDAALGLDDLTFWPTQLRDHRQTQLLFSFAKFPASLRAAFYTVNDFQIVPNGKVQSAHLFGPCVLVATASSWCWHRVKLCLRHGPSNQTDTWNKSRHKWAVARDYQSVCAHEGEPVTW